MTKKIAGNIAFSVAIAAMLAAGAYYARGDIAKIYGSYMASRSYDFVIDVAGAEDMAKPAKRLAKYVRKNEDTQYILSLDGTTIDYPVVTAGGKGNQYYLHHDIDGAYSYPGTLFIDKRTPPGSPITVIHGHQMRSGTLMFHDLKNMKSKKWAKKHKWLRVYSGGDENEWYKLSCAILTPGNQDSFAYIDPGIFLTSSEYGEYVSQLKERSVTWLKGEDEPAFETGDEVIALSTVFVN